MSEMTEGQRKYQERQAAYQAAQEIAERSSDEVMANVRKKWETSQVALERVLSNKPALVQKSFPFLFGSGEETAALARTFMGWSDYHESVSIFNHHGEAFHYEKIREKWDHAKDESGELIRDPGNGRFIKTGRRPGDKWITGKDEKVGHPFPIALWEHVDSFGAIIVCEGEKDALNLNLYGIPSLTMGGAGIGWYGDALELVRGRDVILWFDNDKAGRDGTLGKEKPNGERSRGRYEELREVCSSVTLVDWRLLDPKAPNKADATDYLIQNPNLGPDALIDRLKYCAYRPKNSRTWAEVNEAMAVSVAPLRSERDKELAFMLGRFVEAMKSNKESDEYERLVRRAKEIIAQDETKSKAFAARNALPSRPEDPEELKRWEAVQAKAEKVFTDAIEDAVLIKYFNRTLMGDLRKHVTSDVVLHWEESFRDIGVSFGRFGFDYLYWCGTHFAKVETYQFENTFNAFLELTKVNIKQRYNETSFKSPARAGILSNAYHINDMRERMKEFGVINHQGGTIVIDRKGSMTHKNHDENDGLMYVLPFAYDPDAACPMFQKFLDAVLPDSGVQQIIAEYIGYLFLPRYVQKFPYFYGTGGNGKSTLIDIIKALFDANAVSNLEVLNMHGHELDALNGKIMNLSTELESNTILNQGQISTIKKISVGEPIQVNPKFDKSYVLTRPPKLIMAGNEKLKGGGLNDALTRRMILVPFEQSFPESMADVDLVNKIVEKELPGILNWAIEGMTRLVSNGYRFTKSAVIEESMEEYRVETDQIYSYIKECFAQWEGAGPGDPTMERKLHGLTFMVDEKIKLPTKYIYQHYVEWANSVGTYPLKQQNFSSKLAEKLKTKIIQSRVREVHIEKQYGSDGNRITYPTTGSSLRCIAGYKITSDIKITVNGVPMGVMETVLHGGE